MKKKKWIWIPVVLLFAGVVLLGYSFSILTGATAESFSEQLEKEKELTYQDIYQWAYDRAERENHVANMVDIHLEGIQERANLEVLRVSDTAYVIEKAEDNPENIESWLKIDGTGIYTVDLSMGEFIADTGNQYVLARVPKPVLTDVKCDVPTALLFHNDIFDDSYATGENLTAQMKAEGEAELKKEIRGNTFFAESAEKSAKQFIASFIKELNPEIPELVVEVEFVSGE